MRLAIAIEQQSDELAEPSRDNTKPMYEIISEKGELVEEETERCILCDTPMTKRALIKTANGQMADAVLCTDEDCGDWMKESSIEARLGEIMFSKGNRRCESCGEWVKILRPSIDPCPECGGRVVDLAVDDDDHLGVPR